MPSKNDINPATGQPYAVNPATGQWDDNYWATVVEPRLRSGGAGGATTADQLINTSIQKYTELADKYSSRLTEFEQKNPFVFDNILEEESANAAQRLDPYYNQTLADFLRGVTTRRTRSIDDRDRLITELNQDTESYTGDAKIALEGALEKTREGFADAGLFESGKQMSETGKQEAQTARSLDRFGVQQERRAGDIARTAGRNLEDIGIEEQTGQRDIQRRRAYDVESQSLSETLRRQQQREFEKAQYGGIPPGVDPGSFSTYAYGLLR